MFVPAADTPLAWLVNGITTPPFSALARLEAGQLLRQLQRGDALRMPHSRPMPMIGRRVHELRIQDGQVSWRIVNRVDVDAIVIGEIFTKKSAQMPQLVITTCQKRFHAYDETARE